MSAPEKVIETLGDDLWVVQALDRVGFVIAPKVATTKMICAALDDAERRDRRAPQSLSELYAAMIEARP